jgi:hypothetical protein
MIYIRKLYHPVLGGYVLNSKGVQHKCTHMKCTLRYDLGGPSLFQQGVTRPRGYYMGFSPVTVDGQLESVVAFSGVCFPLVECKRQGKKAEAEAAKLFDERYQEEVRNHFPASRVDFSKTE